MVTLADAVIERLPVAVYAIDDDRFVYVHSKFAETLGYSREAILGFTSALDIIPGGQKTVDAMATTTGTLTIVTSFEAGCVHFKVSDTGEGVLSENLDLIFEPLFTTKKKGSGIGLTVVHQIVNAHGGHVSVESEVGKGTTFDVGIPVKT